MATALEQHVYPEVVPPPLTQVLPVPVKTRPEHHWARWALVAGIVIALAVGVELWRMHSQNAIGYETVPVERGTDPGQCHGHRHGQRGCGCAGRQPGIGQHQSAVRGLQHQGYQGPTRRPHRSPGLPNASRSGPGRSQPSAQSQVQKANADLSGAIASEKGAESVLAKDRATALNATNQYQRLHSLFEPGIISLQDDDAAKASKDAAEAQVAADQSQT